MKIKPEVKITAIIAVPRRKITSSSNNNNNSIKVTEAIISTPLGGDGGLKIKIFHIGVFQVNISGL
jgi:hypothetical protein